MIVIVCDETVDGIFCGIYDAWLVQGGHDKVRLEFNGEDPELFCEYRKAGTDQEKAGRVASSIQKKLSDEIYETVYRGALSQDKKRADKLFRFLIDAFRYGPEVKAMLQLPSVYDLFQLNRHLRFEYHHMLGFTRFSKTEEGLLVGRIGPKNDLTVLLAAHFADRLPEDNWILYDEGRKKAAVHQAGHGWVMVETNDGPWKETLNKKTDEEEYRELWKAFREHVTIRERTNLRCQRNMLPLRFRPYMTEFQEKDSGI